MELKLTNLGRRTERSQPKTGLMDIAMSINRYRDLENRSMEIAVTITSLNICAFDEILTLVILFMPFHYLIIISCFLMNFSQIYFAECSNLQHLRCKSV